MNHANLKANEREIIKLIRFFSKRGAQLAATGTVDAPLTQLTDACQNLETQLYKHAETRTTILAKRKQLETIIEDKAKCPKCHKADMLKKTGIATNECGWKSNTYRCRRCNTNFTWNRPNNPWHMVEFLERYIQELEQNAITAQPLGMKAHIEAAIPQLQDSLYRLRPVLQTSDEEVAALTAKEAEMETLIHQFKNYLLIEKIKLDL